MFMKGYKVEDISINDKILSLDIVKCFYYGYGRNAWYSTWNSFYYPDLIFPNFIEVRNTIEDERKQGSVFTITEVPGLLIKTNTKMFIAVDYTYTATHSNTDLFASLYRSILDSKININTIGICDFKYLFSNSTERSCIYSIENDDDFDRISSSTFYRYSSRSVGIDYYLDYSNKEIIEVTFSSLEKLVSKFNYNNDTIDFYNSNTSSFVESTQLVQMTEAWTRFTSKLQPASVILDFGCGSGRDTKYFLEKGYQVEASDGSEELCKVASEFTGIEVKKQFFLDLSEVSKYDAVWACSSILHASSEDLIIIIKKIWTALKDNGIFYTSFKYGTFEGERNGRYFTDMTEESFSELVSKSADFEIIETWITGDVRPGRENEKWLNVILQKK